MQEFIPEGILYSQYQKEMESQECTAAVSHPPFKSIHENVDLPTAMDESFCQKLGHTGSCPFDFIESVDGTVYAIECNPRTHSAITMFLQPSRGSGCHSQRASS